MNTPDPTDQHAIERQEAREMLSALGLASLYLLPSLPPREVPRDDCVSLEKAL